MNNVKIIVVATVLLFHSPIILDASSSSAVNAPPARRSLGEVGSKDEPISTETTQESEKTPEEEATPSEEETIKEKTQPAIASATAGTEIEKWNDHLESLKEKDQHWNNNSNIPTDSWKEQALSLAKEALNKDKSIAEALKSAFFNAMTEKIKIE